MNDQTDTLILSEADLAIAQANSINDDLPKTVKTRYKVLVLKNERKSNTQIAEQLGVDEHTVGKYIKQYKNDGINSLTNTSGRWHTTECINNAYNNPTNFLSLSND